MSYQLFQEIQAHPRGIRSGTVLEENKIIITGGYDGIAKVWTFNQDQKLELSKEIPLHNGFILSLAPSINKSTQGNITFYSSGNDNAIHYVDINGSIISSFSGHTAAVCNVEESADGKKLYSGSWDGTLRIWDTTTNQQVAVCRLSSAPPTSTSPLLPRSSPLLPHSSPLLSSPLLSSYAPPRGMQCLSGHKHAVCFCVISEDADGTVLVTGSQDKTLRKYKNNQVIQTVPNAHDDIIRKIIHAPNGHLLTISNDSLIKLWDSLSLSPLSSFYGHESFIYSLTLSPSPPVSFASGGDDKKILLWQGLESSEPTQIIPYPKPIFFLSYLSLSPLSSPLLTIGGEDGTLRLFSADPSQHASEQELNAFALSCIPEPPQTNQSINLQNLLLFRDKEKVQGRKRGQTKLFNQDGKVVVCQWSGREWEYLGEMVDGDGEKEGEKSRNKLYEGDEYFPMGYYDYIFDVEISGVIKKLPINKDSNRLTSAEKFLVRENIHKTNLQQIIQFLQEHLPQAGETQERKGEERRGEEKKGEERREERKGDRGEVEYASYGFTAKNVNTAIDAILSNGEVNELEKEYLGELKEKLMSPEWRKKEIRKCEVDLVFKDLVLREKALLPTVDLMRMMLLHDVSLSLYSGLDYGWGWTRRVLEIMERNMGSNVLIMCLRYLVNGFVLGSVRRGMVKTGGKIFGELWRMGLLEKEGKEGKGGRNKGTVGGVLFLIGNWLMVLEEESGLETVVREGYEGVMGMVERSGWENVAVEGVVHLGKGVLLRGGGMGGEKEKKWWKEVREKVPGAKEHSVISNVCRALGV